MRKRLESILPKDHEGHIAEKGVQFDELLSGAKVCFYVSSDENSRCERIRGQRMGEARKNASIAIAQSEAQKGGYSGSTESAKNSSFWYADGHLTSQKR